MVLQKTVVLLLLLESAGVIVGRGVQKSSVQLWVCTTAQICISRRKSRELVYLV